MIAEYERAQILERSRRGKRHRAHAGEISVLSNAPYGYRYIRKTDEAPAAYRVHEAEAGVVQRVYEMYTVEGLSIGEITRRLNAEGIPTRKASARWERSTVWAGLQNPAYRGAACFGKTRGAKCGYAFSRTSTQTSARKIHYYKCIGSDSWRKLGGPVCDNGRFVRQEFLDQIVWAEVFRLLEEPALIQQELDCRLVAARASDPTQKREQSLQRELTHIGKGIGGFTQKIRGVTKDAVPKCSPGSNEGLPIKPDSFMLVSITTSFLCAVFIAYLQRRSEH